MSEMTMARAAISTPIVTLSDTEGRIDMPKMRRYRTKQATDHIS